MSHLQRVLSTLAPGIVAVSMLAAPALASAQGSDVGTAVQPRGEAAASLDHEDASLVPDQRAIQLDLVGGVSALAAPGEIGLAFALGARLAMGPHTALRFDIGYGVMGGDRSLEDRWWLIPSFAVVMPVDRLRIELGLGVGFATSSGYTDFDAFVREPFEDDWAYQLVPAMRGHGALWLELGADVDAYMQIDAGGLLTQGNSIGLRAGPGESTRRPIDAQLMWSTLTVGTSIRLY